MTEAPEALNRTKEIQELGRALALQLPAELCEVWSSPVPEEVESVLYRPLREDDYARVLAAVSDWWDEPALAGRATERVSLVPRLFFQHFGDTSFLLEQDARGNVVLRHGAELGVALAARHLQGAFEVTFDGPKLALNDFVVD